MAATDRIFYFQSVRSKSRLEREPAGDARVEAGVIMRKLMA